MNRTGGLLRILRNSPQHKVNRILEATNATKRALRTELRSVDPRGECAAAAAAAAANARRTDNRERALEHPTCPPYAARAAGTDRAGSVRASARGVAGWSTRSSENFSVPRSTAAAAVDDVSTRELVLRRAWCPPLWQTALSVPHQPLRMREALSHPSAVCAAAGLAALASDPADTVRSNVAAHSGAGRFLRSRLASDPAIEVRGAAAANGDVTTDAFDQLASDPAPHVRDRLAQSKAPLPGFVLDRLAGDPSDAVREHIAMRKPDRRGRGGCPTRLLRRLATDTDTTVRRAVAASPATPVDVLAELASDPQPEVRAKTAANHNTTPEVLERLAEDRLQWVRGWAAANPRTPLKVLTAMAVDRAYAIRSMIATIPGIPEPVLVELAKDPRTEVRMALAQRRGLSGKLRRLLSKDPESSVRTAERYNYSVVLDP